MQSQHQITAQSFYNPLSKSPSIKITIKYSKSTANLSYNFQLNIKLSKQILLPTLCYESVYEQKYLFPKTEVIINSVEEKKMYKVEVSWSRKGTVRENGNNKSENHNNPLSEQNQYSKTLFVFSQAKSSQEQQQQQFQAFQQSNRLLSHQQVITIPTISKLKPPQHDITKLLKQNIRGYFNEYYGQQQKQKNTNKNNKNNRNNRKDSILNRNKNQFQNQKKYVKQSFSNHKNKEQRNPSYTESNLPLNSSIKRQNTVDNNLNKNKKHNSSIKTPSTLCNSQMMVKLIGQNQPFINKKNLQKYILQSRKSSSIKDYLSTKDFQCFNHFNKTYKNQQQRKKHIEKTLLVSKAINMFDQIYSFEKEYGTISENQRGQYNISNSNKNIRREQQPVGMKQKQNKKGKQFFKNDWFMGPFYSYDANQVQMKNNKNKINSSQQE